MINIKNKNDINLDISDLDTIFSHEGFAYIKTIYCKNIDGCLEEVRNFNFNPKGVIVKFKISNDLPLIELKKFIDFICEISDENADIIFGSETTESAKIEINLIFTGINLKT